MKTRFHHGQRLIINEPITKNEQLLGRTCTVVRLLHRSSEEAWVNVDGEPVPSECRMFPENDEHGRGNHILVWDEECTEAVK